MNRLSSIYNRLLWVCLMTMALILTSGLSHASSAICSSATVYDDSFTINNETTVGGGDNFNLGLEENLCFGPGEDGEYFNDTGLGPDNVVTFTSAYDEQDVLVSLQPYSADLAVYIVTDCDDVDDSCVWVSDGGGSGELETILFDAQAGVNYYIIVDGYGNQSGSYDLTLDVPTGGLPEVVYVDFDAPKFGDGSKESPKRNVASALNAVEAGGIIRINGNSAVTFIDQTFTGSSVIDKAVTIQANPSGSNGVSIGGDASADTAPSGDDAEGSESGYVTRGAR